MRTPVGRTAPGAAAVASATATNASITNATVSDLTVNGSFSPANASANRQWIYNVLPKIGNALVATKSYIDMKLQATNGDAVATALNG